jgi:hypothetical protein
VLIDADDPPLCRDWVHDPNPVLVKQRIELGAERAEAAGLHLNELSIGADDVDHEASDWHLQTVTWLRQHRLERSVERSLADHPDARHVSQARASVGADANPWRRALETLLRVARRPSLHQNKKRSPAPSRGGRSRLS